MSVENCIFCSIAAGTVPSEQVLATEDVVAFRDLNPQAPVHVLVIPRRHIVDASTLEPDDGAVLAAMFVAAQQVAAQTGIAASGYRLAFNVGEDAANSVPHLHLHVVGGRRLGWPPG